MRWLLKIRNSVGPTAGAAWGAGAGARLAIGGDEAGGPVAGLRAAAGMAPSPAPIEGGGGGWERRRAGFPAMVGPRFDSGSVGGRPGTASAPVACAPAAA